MITNEIRRRTRTGLQWAVDSASIPGATDTRSSPGADLRHVLDCLAEEITPVDLANYSKLAGVIIAQAARSRRQRTK